QQGLGLVELSALVQDLSELVRGVQGPGIVVSSLPAKALEDAADRGLGSRELALVRAEPLEVLDRTQRVEVILAEQAPPRLEALLEKGLGLVVQTHAVVDAAHRGHHPCLEQGLSGELGPDPRRAAIEDLAGGDR